MKRTIKKTDRHEYIIEEFNSYNELITVNDSREQNFGKARTASDRKWYGSTYEEAIEMLRYGWQDKEKVNRVMEKIGELEKMQETQKMSFKNDIVGYAPIVPLAMLGVPQNMINCTRKPKKAKVINLVIDISVSCNVDSESILDWGAKMVSKVINLEKQGFRVRIDIIKTFIDTSYGTKAHVLKLPIKNENQPFDIQRMMFPIAHTAMGRRIGFDWYERLPEAEQLGGYGTPLIHHTRERAEEIKRNILDTKNSYIIHRMEDIENILKGVA